MSTANNTYWFKRRRFGYGWVPVTPQGWLVLLGYLGVILGGIKVFVATPNRTFTPETTDYLVLVAAATAILIYLCLSHGPKPRWRWGKRPTDNPREDW